MATSIATEPMAKKARTDPEEPTGPTPEHPQSGPVAKIDNDVANEVATVRVDVCETVTTITTTTSRNKNGRVIDNDKETKTRESYKTVIWKPCP